MPPYLGTPEAGMRPEECVLLLSLVETHRQALFAQGDARKVWKDISTDYNRTTPGSPAKALVLRSRFKAMELVFKERILDRERTTPLNAQELLISRIWNARDAYLKQHRYHTRASALRVKMAGLDVDHEVLVPGDSSPSGLLNRQSSREISTPPESPAEAPPEGTAGLVSLLKARLDAQRENHRWALFLAHLALEESKKDPDKVHNLSLSLKTAANRARNKAALTFAGHFDSSVFDP